MELGGEAAAYTNSRQHCYKQAHTEFLLSPWPGDIWEYLLLANIITSLLINPVYGSCSPSDLHRRRTWGVSLQCLRSQTIYLRLFGGPCKWTVPLSLAAQSDLRHFTRECCGLVDCCHARKEKFIVCRNQYNWEAFQLPLENFPGYGPS